MRINSMHWTAGFKGAALGTLLAGAVLPAAAQTVYGLAAMGGTAPTSLVTFMATAPSTFTATLPITGLTLGQTLVGPDSRPNTGQLFALGYNPTGTQAHRHTGTIIHAEPCHRRTCSGGGGTHPQPGHHDQPDWL